MKKILISTLAIMCLIAGSAFLYISNSHDSSASKKTKISKKSNAAKIVSPNNETDAKNSDENDMEIITGTADRLFSYRTLGQLTKDATLVVEGKVIDVSYFDYNTEQYTKLKFEVAKVLMGTAKEGDVLTIIELGGITTRANMIRYNGNKFNQTITQEDEDAKVQHLFDEAPLTEVNEEILYFLKPTVFKEVHAYYPLASNQAKFVITGNSIERHARDCSSMKMNKTDFEEKVSEEIRKNQ